MPLPAINRNQVTGAVTANVFCNLLHVGGHTTRCTSSIHMCHGYCNSAMKKKQAAQIYGKGSLWPVKLTVPFWGQGVKD